MRIIKIWDADYPWDVRVEKIAKTLSRRDHDVHLVCRNLAGRPRSEEIDGFTVHRLRTFPGVKLNYMLQFPFFLNPIWLAEILKVGREQKADLIMVRDLPMVPAALLAGRSLAIPVLFDMAEDYPAMLADGQSSRQRRFFSDRLVRNPKYARMIENRVLPKVDHILVVTDEMKEKLVARGVDRSKVTVVSNTPDLADFDNSEMTPAVQPLAESLSGQYSIIYHGGLEDVRGLDIIIQAMPVLTGRKIDAHLYLFGRGDTSHLSDLAERLGLASRVHLMGWWPLSDILAVIGNASVGVIPHLRTEHTNTTVPNKLFDYMAVGLPVVASDTSPMSRIIGDCGCGLTFESGNTEALAEALLNIFERTDRKTMGRKGRKAVETLYNWSHDGDRLITTIEKWNE